MRYRRLGRTGLKVSALCLGSMQFGWTADQAEAFRIMDAFTAAGGNFIDTADIYSFWVEGNSGGVSERIIGQWLAQRGNRREVVIATKVRGRMWPGPNGEGLSRAHIIQACEDSLRRLRTDYIDLYQAHWYDEETPMDETMEAFHQLRQQGKVRYLGCSNYPAWRLMEALWTSDRLGLARYDSLQPHYNLVHRAEFERELRDVAQAYGLGVIPYSPLAGGFLTGKYRRGERTESVRAEGVARRYVKEQSWRILDVVREVAEEVGASPGAVALAWLLAQPTVTAPILGANSVEQLQANLAGLDVGLSAAQLARLDAVSSWQEG